MTQLQELTLQLNQAIEAKDAYRVFFTIALMVEANLCTPNPADRQALEEAYAPFRSHVRALIEELHPDQHFMLAQAPYIKKGLDDVHELLHPKT